MRTKGVRQGRTESLNEDATDYPTVQDCAMPCPLKQPYRLFPRVICPERGVRKNSFIASFYLYPRQFIDLFS